MATCCNYIGVYLQVRILCVPFTTTPYDQLNSGQLNIGDNVHCLVIDFTLSSNSGVFLVGLYQIFYLAGNCNPNSVFIIVSQKVSEYEQLRTFHAANTWLEKSCR